MKTSITLNEVVGVFLYKNKYFFEKRYCKNLKTSVLYISTLF